MGRESFNLDSKYVGVLPIVNHFLRRLGFTRLLARYLPPCEFRSIRGISLELGASTAWHLPQNSLSIGFFGRYERGSCLCSGAAS